MNQKVVVLLSLCALIVSCRVITVDPTASGDYDFTPRHTSNSNGTSSSISNDGLLPETLPPVLSAVYTTNAQINTNITGYWECLPGSYASQIQQRYPLIVCLHGMGELASIVGTNLNSVKNYGLRKMMGQANWPNHFTASNGSTYSVVVIQPQFVGWPSPYHLNKILDYATSLYRINTNRIYITGLSMGGGLTWTHTSASTANALRIAAIVPVCGANNGNAAGYNNIATSQLPSWIFHNQTDPTVPTSYSTSWEAGLNAVTPGIARLTIFPVTGHDAWTAAYDVNYRENGKNMIEWMLQYRR